MNVARIRHVPVVDKIGDFVGLITHRDILAVTVSRLAGIAPEVQADLDGGIKARDIMNNDVCTVEPGTDLKDAAKMLLRHKYGCLPVLEGQRLIGMITEADFLRLTIHLLDAVGEAI
jgi:CBS domain-containing membrane protein